MSRAKDIKKGLKKTMKVMTAMKESRSPNNTKCLVKITRKLSLEINCQRVDWKDDPNYGMPLGFEIYAIKDSRAVDCATIDTNGNFEEDILYLLNCYI